MIHTVILLILFAVILFLTRMAYRIVSLDVIGRKHEATVRFAHEEMPPDGEGYQQKTVTASIELPIESPLNSLCDAMIKETNRLYCTVSRKEREKIREFLLEAASIAAPMWQDQRDAIEKELVEVLLKKISGNGCGEPHEDAEQDTGELAFYGDMLKQQVSREEEHNV